MSHEMWAGRLGKNIVIVRRRQRRSVTADSAAGLGYHGGMNSEKLALLLTYEMPYGKYKGRKLADLPGHYLG